MDTESNNKSMEEGLIAKVGVSPKGIHASVLGKTADVPASTVKRPMEKLVALGLAFRVNIRGGWLATTGG